jgi:hypothetical protein
MVPATKEDMIWIRAYEQELAWRARQRLADQAQRRQHSFWRRLASAPLLSHVFERAQTSGRKHVRDSAPYSQQDAAGRSATATTTIESRHTYS